jgi:hypothetical protein
MQLSSSRHQQESRRAGHWTAAIQQGHKVLYRETHMLLEDLADPALDGTRKQ